MFFPSVGHLAFLSVGLLAFSVGQLHRSVVGRWHDVFVCTRLLVLATRSFCSCLRIIGIFFFNSYSRACVIGFYNGTEASMFVLSEVLSNLLLS